MWKMRSVPIGSEAQEAKDKAETDKADKAASRGRGSGWTWGRNDNKKD